MIKWVNLRTRAPLDLPCSVCGKAEDVEMHHIRAIRKRKYTLIPEENFWEKGMALRNRKQIPVCKECHIHVIHKGNYTGSKLGALIPKVMYENRLVTIESSIHRGRPETIYYKTLEDKGWKPVEPGQEM